MIAEAKWSGKYPTLCFGKWSLKVNGKDISHAIPTKLRHTSMNTYGWYSSWHFENWMEVFDKYEDGLKEDEWIEENDYWLYTITNDKNLKQEIFRAIQKEDFRSGECGGCI